MELVFISPFLLYVNIPSSLLLRHKRTLLLFKMTFLEIFLRGKWSLICKLKDLSVSPLTHANQSINQSINRGRFMKVIDQLGKLVSSHFSVLEIRKTHDIDILLSTYMST